MARFIVAAVLLTTLAYSSLAVPQDYASNKEDVQGLSPLTVLPAESGKGSERFFFFPFNFWNGFRPLPWIPLPGLNPRTTTASPAVDNSENGNEGDDQDDEDDQDDDQANEDDQDDDQADEDDQDDDQADEDDQDDDQADEDDQDDDQADEDD